MFLDTRGLHWLDELGQRLPAHLRDGTLTPN